MENRRKFYFTLRKKNEHGAWSQDTLEQRYVHILNVLKVYSNMDDEDLKFIIKNAFYFKDIYIC